MHFGPTEAERAAGAAAGGDAASKASGAGFAGKRTGAFSTAEAWAHNQAAFAAAAQAETVNYRKFAESYRAAKRAQERSWPTAVLALGALLFGTYHFVRKVQER